ncbi:sugar phosphate isomerase/epimerase family protein [Spirosoma validum]|uniref:Sugar phosphate isomerase/epimerase n=1 Tax=Spirosoma validum TaxID=2771355 RepID=A0A927B473_9BACT|nr:sugar phosphate isomerase/epimerase family protein [Spirosoma validum]MBD2755316.1 sugar phosphate isomerase/epimerase [Spirosoma validum]
MRNLQPDRRAFLKSAVAGIPLVATAGTTLDRRSITNAGNDKSGPLRLSCNLYSFNEPLMSGQMTLEQVFTFCSELGFDAVDPTGYYFPKYPTLPDDNYVYQIKRKAFRLGLDISGTGVRNDFTLPDLTRRKAEIELVRQWTGLAARLGAPVLRVFAGTGKELPAGYNRKEVTAWVVDALRECADYAAKQGVLIVLQNHADFIRTADDILEIINQVNSEWLAVNLDIGSFKIGDPYGQIARVAPYAATWQLKENLFVDGRETETDLNRIMRIVRESGYRGYLPIETLGKGDPRQKVPVFYEKVSKALAAVSPSGSSTTTR